MRLKDTNYKTPRKESIPGKPVYVHLSVEREVLFRRDGQLQFPLIFR